MEGFAGESLFKAEKLAISYIALSRLLDRLHHKTALDPKKWSIGLMRFNGTLGRLRKTFVCINISQRLHCMNSWNDRSVFRVTPDEVELFSSRTYKVQFIVGLTKLAMHPMKCLLDRGAGLNIINDEYLTPQSRKQIQQLPIPRLWTAQSRQYP